jgi:lysophospholipase L1-like esterase
MFRKLFGTSLAVVALTGGLLAPPAAAAPSQAEQPRVLAALGDSYSSGEAVPPFDPTAPGCDRSDQAWPLLAADALGLRGVNLACSGAKTADVVTEYKGQPAQVAALAALRPRPAVVTITIGGNDAGFATVLGACVLTDCVETKVVAAADVTILTVLPERLRKTYRAVHKAAPSSRLVVVGYPRLFPQRQSAVTGCPWLSDRERRELNRAADLLNLVTRLSAYRSGARYVDVSSSLAGHELCTKDSWVFPIGVGDAPQYWAHPTLPGQQAIAARVTAALAR